MKKILVVEDSIDINNLLCKILDTNGYESSSVITAREALLELKYNNYDLILLDLMMPGMSGEELLREIRKTSNVAIIIISAKISKDTKIDVLKSGADVFIEKPFDNDEVIAQVEATIRRADSKDNSNQNILIYKDIEMNLDSKIVTLSGELIKLTPIEFNILKLLMENNKKIYSKENIYLSVWKDDYFYDADTINVHISNIRGKIKKVSGLDYIETVWGMGYRLR